MTLYIPVGTKKFPLIIKNTGKVDPEDGELVEVYCKEANLNQEYLKSDIVYFYKIFEPWLNQSKLKKRW